MMKTFARLLLSSAVLSVLTGCVSTSHDEVNISNKLKSLPPIDLPESSGIKGLPDSSHLDSIQINNDNMFVSAPLCNSDTLPDITIENVSLSGNIYDMMQTLLANASIPLSISDDPGNVMRRNVAVVNISGNLKNILDDLSNSVGFFWYYKNGVLNIMPTQQYIATLPPINEIFESLPTMIKTLGGIDVFLDKSNRVITYQADKPSQDKIASYLEYVRNNKSMIVYDTFIWEVILNDSNSAGIQWNQLGRMSTQGVNMTSLQSAATAAAASNGIGFSAVFTGSRFSIDSLISFLKSQGTINTISQPKLNLISGGTASFRDGKSTFYVSGLGAPTITSAGQTVSGSATTTPLQTGVDMTISGDISDGTVYTAVKLFIRNLLGFMPYPAGQNMTLNLPNIADREVNTSIRAVSGDTILLAGINSERSSRDLSGLPFGGDNKIALPTQVDRAVERSELVIVIKPRIIKFVRHEAGPAK